MKDRPLARFAILLSALLALVVPAANSAEGDRSAVNGTEQWVALPYMVTKAERDLLFASPAITTAPGFRASILVPPGKVYDPFDLFVLDSKTMLVADDGADGHIWKITAGGHVESLAAPTRYAPYTFDVAPASFGKFHGQIYALAFNEPNAAGGWELPDAIVRIDPATGRDSLVCYLPDNANHEKGAGGFFVRFGPENSPFAGKLWITTASNHSIYQVTPDDGCKVVETIDLDKWGSPRGIAFTPDGKVMLLGSVTPSPANRAKTVDGGGRILQMHPDGTIDDKPFAIGLTEPGAMAFAPSGFGHFGGELFVAEVGKWDNDIGITQEPNKGPFAQVHSDGLVYRVTRNGKLAMVASGLRNPVGVGFMGDTLIVTDINGDFHEGYQKFPDGFVVSIRAQ
jgi:hypothetical protein